MSKEDSAANETQKSSASNAAAFEQKEPSASSNMKPSNNSPSKVSEERFRRLALFIGLLAVTVGTFSYFDPYTAERLFQNTSGWLFTLIGSSFIAIYLAMRVGGEEKTKSFLDIDEDIAFQTRKDHLEALARLEKEFSARQHVVNTYNMVSGDLVPPNSSTPAPIPESPFVAEAKSMISYLESRIDLSERKASMLLDQGTSYLRRGIYFFVVSIIVWQVLMHFVGFRNYMWFGIISCSLTFLVIEFLAAWFLKQYRNYGDSSIAYLRVSTTFSRYLLNYHAIKEIDATGDHDSGARNLMVDALREDVKWPSLQGLNANDFNFMIETIGSFNSVIDKLRGAVVKDHVSG